MQSLRDNNRDHASGCLQCRVELKENEGIAREGKNGESRDDKGGSFGVNNSLPVKRKRAGEEVRNSFSN